MNGLYHSLALPEDKLIANPESKAIKPRVQSILKKSNLLMVTFLGKIYEELRSKDFNREKILKLLFQLKEKIQGLEQVEDAKILSQMFYEYLIKNWVSPTVELLVNGTKQSKTFIVQLPADMKNVDLKKLIENAKVKFTELKDATFIIYKDKVKVVMSKEGLKEIGFGIFDAAHRKVNDVKNFDYKGLDVKKKSLELLNSGKENSMELYRNVKEGLINKKESIRKQLHERKIKKGLSEKFIEMSNKITEEKNKELQEKIMEEIAMKKEGTKEIAQEKENEEIEEEKISQDQ